MREAETPTNQVGVLGGYDALRGAGATHNKRPTEALAEPKGNGTA